MEESRAVLADNGIRSSLDPEDAREFIGFTFDEDGKRWYPSVAQVSLFIAATLHILTPGVLVSGRELEVYLRHATHICGINGALSCIPLACYKFVKDSYDRRGRIWRSVARELSWYLALAPLAECDMTRPWFDVVQQYDSSLQGFGTVYASVDVRLVAKVGRLRERDTDSQVCTRLPRPPRSGTGDPSDFDDYS